MSTGHARILSLENLRAGSSLPEVMKRKKVVIDAERCKGCALCVAACSLSLIRMSKGLNRKGVHFAGFDGEDRCTGCTHCALMCPEAAIEVLEVQEASRAPASSGSGPSDRTVQHPQG
jgi:2-oxoglutarate ferredoxin oxidoreductase subunit delta